MTESTQSPQSRMTGRRRLYLMRHGHVDYFAPDIEDPRTVSLTEKGRAQASAAREALAAIPFDFAACSGLPRTRETAQIVLSAHVDPPVLVEDLRLEELKSGWLRVESREELAARIAFCFDDAGGAEARFLPDGETFADAEARIVDAIRDCLLRCVWRTGLLVAHEGVNRILFGWITGGGLSTIGVFEQDLCAINVIDFDITPTDPDAKETAGLTRPLNGLHIERAVLKQLNVTPYDVVKDGLRRTSLEHLFEVDFGASRPSRV